jgi:hypothetical protein
MTPPISDAGATVTTLLLTIFIGVISKSVRLVAVRSNASWEAISTPYNFAGTKNSSR